MTVDRRKYCQFSSTDDGPVYRNNRALFIGLSWQHFACDDLRAVAKFSKFRVRGREKYLIIFGNTRIPYSTG